MGVDFSNKRALFNAKKLLGESLLYINRPIDRVGGSVIYDGGLYCDHHDHYPDD